jgi:hypothetical protein
MGALTTTEDLPLENCSREDIKSQIETAKPAAGLVDGATLEVANDLVQAKHAVPRWEKVTVGYATVKALGSVLTGQVTLLTLPDGGVVHATKVMSSVQWVGTGIATLVADVGIVGTPTKYSSGYNLLAAPATDNYDLEFITGGEQQTVAGGGSGTALKLRVTSTAANLDVLTAGSVIVWVLWSATDV